MFFLPFSSVFSVIAWQYLKARAKPLCDILKCQDRLIILPNYVMKFDGRPIRWSNIYNVILQKALKQPSPGRVQFEQIEDENKRLKWRLKHAMNELEKEQGLPICTKFESIFNGTVQYFDETNDEDDCENEEEDEEEDEEEEDEEEDGEDGEEGEEENDEESEDDSMENKEDVSNSDDTVEYYEDSVNSGENEVVPQKKKKN